MTKFLIGAGVTAVGITVTAVYAKKCQEKKYIDTNETEENVEVEETPIERVKTYALKKSIRFFAWVAVHQNEIQSLSLVLGVVGGVLSIVNAVKEYAFGKKLHSKLATIDSKLDKIFNELYSFNDDFQHSWNSKVDWDIERHNAVLEAINMVHSDVVA